MRIRGNTSHRRPKGISGQVHNPINTPSIMIALHLTLKSM